MPRPPVLDFLLDHANLTGGETRGDQRNARLAGFISSSLCQEGPEICAHGIGRYAAARPVTVTQHGLSRNVVLLGSQREPADRLRIVLRNLVSRPVALADVKLRDGVAASSQLSQCLQLGGRSRRRRGCLRQRRRTEITATDFAPIL